MFKRVLTLSLLVAVYCELSGMKNNLFDEVFQSGPAKNTTKRKPPEVESCLTDNGEKGECMPFYICPKGQAIVDGEGVINLRMGVADDDELPCSKEYELCCIPPDMQDQNDPIVPIMDSEYTGCGWRNPNGLGFKMSGQRDNEAEFGEFPWMVAILQVSAINSTQSKLEYIGGGSLIHPRAVLTAAHTLRTTWLRVRAGEWDTQTDREQYPFQERDVAEVDVHEGFNALNVHYDAALLLLTEPFDLAPNVGLACIPNPDEPLDYSSECFATGWGREKYGRKELYQSILKKIELQLVDHDTCQSRLRTTRLHKYFQLHSSFVCAGGRSGKDTCTGDGGSPLVCPTQSDPTRYKQVGIVSWGVHCGKDGIPAVYADVSTIAEWIDRRLALRGLDTSLYRY